MHKHILFALWCLFYGYFLCATALAQTTPPATVPFCGTEDLTLEQARSLVKEAELARQKKMASGAAFQAVTYVPLRPHIMRQSNGTGGLSLAKLNQVMAITNSYYLLNGLGIQFYFAGSTPDYIDNDAMYNSYDSQSVDAYDAPNAMNQYYVNQFSDFGLGGFAYYPFDGIYSTRSFILGGVSEDDLGNRLIPHELGHNFNLIHTFGQNAGNGSLGSGVTTELVTRGTGANCASDGDLVCDTPADPYNMNGAYLSYVNGCPQYDSYNSTARDANGYLFSPSVTNIMSYYFPCTHDFTPGQYDRMQAGLALRQSHTAYTLDAPPTNVTAPGNLAASANGTSIVLTWQDNASNEMGYFIERSLSSNAGFVPIGGVAPDVTTFTDSKAVPYTQYYYRIRPSNTTTGSLSPNAAMMVSPPITGLFTSNISASNAQLNWNSLGAGITYIVQYRVVGSPDWLTLSNLTSNYYTLYNLSVNTNYEWQVKATNAALYNGPVNFTNPCPTPSLYTTYPVRTSTGLSWTYGYLETYTLQWRLLYAPDWTTVDGLSSTTYSLSGLTASTAYEWRVRGTCPGSTTVVTDYSSPQSFTTQACPIPNIRLNTVNSSSATLYWYTNFSETGRLFSLRYRAVGASDWITISNLTIQEYYSYTLTSLITNTPYEAQVESVCSPTEHSGFSTSVNFTPSCQVSTNLYSTAKNSTATLGWGTYYQAEPGTTFELQYRPLGNPDWTTVSNNISISGYSTIVYSLSGLSSNTTYEWRVKSICPGNIQSNYVAGTNFTTGCTAPVNVYWRALSSTSAGLNWNVSVEPNTRFNIRYRQVGATDWIVLSNLTVPDISGSFNYNLTGLINNTTYEWQVRTVCSATDNSAFVAGPNFTTSCQIPINRTSNPRTTIAYLNWASMGVDVSYDLRYRRLGATDWITITNLTLFNIAITGLQTNTGYEWQVRSRCSDGLFSDYSPSVSFGTYPCYSPGSLSASTQTPTSVRFSWYNYYTDDNARYEVRYRIVGTPNWTIVSNLTSTSVLVTNLTLDVQYEWQARCLCSSTESSDFSYASLFQTCSILYTLRAGNWTDSSLWSCSRVPSITDVVQIKHAILIPAYNTANALKVIFDAGKQLNYGQNATLRLGQ